MSLHERNHELQSMYNAQKREQERRQQEFIRDLSARRLEQANALMQSAPATTAASGLASGLKSVAGGLMSYYEDKAAAQQAGEAQDALQQEADMSALSGGEQLASAAVATFAPQKAESPAWKKTDYGRQLMAMGAATPANTAEGGFASGLQSIAGGLTAQGENGENAIDRVVRAIEERRRQGTYSPFMA